MTETREPYTAGAAVSDAELNLLIAEKVMNYPGVHNEFWQCPDFLNDPAACALILDEMVRRGWAFRIEYSRTWRAYSVGIWAHGPDYPPDVDEDWKRAVCIAALRAVGVEVGGG